MGSAASRLNKLKEYMMRRLFAIIAMACGLLVPLSIGSSSPASAYCSGANSPIWWSVGWGSEEANSLTCDGLFDYNGVLQDNSLDGYDVRIRYNLFDGAGVQYSQWAVALNTNYWWGFWDTNSSSIGAACRGTTGGCSADWTNSGY